MRLGCVSVLGVVAACASSPRTTAAVAPSPQAAPQRICRLEDPARADLITLAKECPDYSRFDEIRLSGMRSFEIYQQAADIMMRQAKAHPDSARVLYNAAGLNMGLRTLESVRLLRRAAELEPGAIAIRIDLAQGYYLMGNPGSQDRSKWVPLAFDQYRDLLVEVKPIQGRRMLLDHAADVAVWAGHLDAAQAWAEESLAFASSTPHSWEPTSPQLASFGPDFSLAQALLEKRVGAEKDVVFALSACEKIWEMNEGRVAAWIAEIERGEIPRFR
jgi:hypothetical protein